MIKIGLIFRREREKKGLTIDEVALKTRIKAPFLAALENGDFKTLPSTAYAFGFVRNYARFLDLPEEKTLALFKREYGLEEKIVVLPQSYIKEEVFPTRHIKIQYAIVGGIAIFLLLIGYLFFQYKGAIFAPSVFVSSPQEQA